MIDTDSSGMISIEELKAAFDCQGNHTHDQEDELFKQMMQEVDKNGDNQISFDEFTDAMTALLKRIHGKK